MHVLVIILTVIVAILLIGIVLIQKSKGGGLSSQFGGAGAVMGVRQTNDFLEKGTWWLAGLIVVLSIISAYTMPQISTGSEIRSQQTQQMPATGSNQFGTPAAPEAAPATPAAPAEAAPAAPAEAAPAAPASEEK